MFVSFDYEFDKLMPFCIGLVDGIGLTNGEKLLLQYAFTNRTTILCRTSVTTKITGATDLLNLAFALLVHR